ncbi:MAG: PAS domain-containing protein [Nitrospiraceae bacterium]|nr:PAS domain-containing protein [Nitrospiraceae bacterium]
MFKINFPRHVFGILLISFISVFLFATYNIYYVFPSFSDLLTKDMEDETEDIAKHFNTRLSAMGIPLEKASIVDAVKQESSLLKKNFMLWRIRLISPEGQIVFSTEPSEAGMRIKGKFFYDIVAKGHIYKSFIPKSGLTPSGFAAPADLALAYVPLIEKGKFAGACEVNNDVSYSMGRIDSLLLKSFLTLALLVFGLLSAIISVSLKANRLMGAKQMAEEALQRSEYFLRTIIETEPECVKLIARDNTLLMMNPAGLAMIEASSFEEVKGKPLTDLISSEYCGAFEDLTRRVLSGHAGSLEFEITGLKGRRLWMEMNAVPFTNEKGEITGLLGITRDVTAKKLWTETLERSLREKETLIRELYHRTKNNMQVISSLISLQSASVTDNRILQMFNDTKNRIRAMSLVHEKLYQSKDLFNVNMKEYISDLANAMLESSAEVGRNVAMKIEAESIQLPIDVIMPCGLIIGELITNSMKYAFTGGRKGEIRISFRQTDTGLMEIIYGDDGPGLPTTDLKGFNTLGLKLVHNLATKQLGGDIQLEPGRKSEFRITFKI